MTPYRINLIIGAACLACILLIVFQVQWMRQSRRLFEENFQQKVNMAMCAAVNQLAEKDGGCNAAMGSCMETTGSTTGSNFQQALQLGGLDRELRRALDFYQINEQYTWKVMPKDSFRKETASAFQCSLSPIVADDSHLLQIEFPQKFGYFLKQIGVVLASSIAILLFITFVFALASFGLRRQQRITHQNIDFFNNMAHEFRTPLTNISLAARMLTRKYPELADHPLLDIIGRESRQMNQQLERILHLSRLESNPQTLAREAVDLPALIQQVTTTMDPQIRERDARVEISCQGVPSPVRGDAFHLSNAFRNLIDNSLKYCRDKPHIRIDIADQGPNVCINVQDNGIGISPENQAHVFQKFQRVGTGNVHQQKGFGIGLSYVKSIVDQHQGSIRLFSDHNCGARFELQFPKN